MFWYTVNIHQYGMTFHDLFTSIWLFILRMVLILVIKKKANVWQQQYARRALLDNPPRKLQAHNMSPRITFQQLRAPHLVRPVVGGDLKAHD